MSSWKDVLPILLVLLLLNACGAEQTKTSEPNQAQSKTKSTTQPAVADGDAGDDTPLGWPAELMGDIPPAPGGIITSIDPGSTFFGESAPDYITVVSLKGMDPSNCEVYRSKLKKLGYLDDATEEGDDSSFLYSGSNNNDGSGVTFQYDFEKNSGFVSYNPMLTDDLLQAWPADQMGNLPDPGCSLISFRTDGTGDDQVCSVDFAGMDEPTAAEYAAGLKTLGYLPETETSDGETILFKGFNGKENGVVFQYSVIYENGTISYGKKDALSGC